MSPRPSKIHQRIGFRLANALEAVLPDDLEVALDWSWTVGGDEFIAGRDGARGDGPRW